MSPALRHSTTAAALLLAALLGGHVSAQQLGGRDAKLYAEAMANYNRHLYRQAAHQLRKVAARNQGSAEVQFWLGMTAVKDGFNATAIRRYFSRCIELDPAYPHPLAHYYMALVHYTDERYDEAIGELQLYFDLAGGTDDKEVMAVYEEASDYLRWSRFLGEARLNRAPFDPRRVAGVSSREDEMMPLLTWSGRTMYYLRRVPLKRGPTFYNRELEQKHWMLYCSAVADTAFSAGYPLDSPFNSGLPEGGVSLTAGDDELYFSIITDTLGYANSDIYCVRRVDGKWQQPERLGSQVNGPRSWESQPTVSPDGGTLVFASNRQGGHGGIDLWRCHRLPGGDWSRAENLGASVNTAGNEKAPFLAADGHTLYFLSDGHQGFGGYDLFFTDLADRYASPPVNLGLPINSDTDEPSLGVTADGATAYYAGRLPGGQSADVLMFDLYPAARPEAMRYVCLEVTDSAGTPLAATATLASGARFTGRGSLPVMMHTSRDDVMLIESEGFFPVVVSLRHQAVARGRVGQTFTLGGLRAGAAHPLEVDDRMEERLEALASWLLEHPLVRIRVECPRAADAGRALECLKRCGLRPDRLASRSGSAVTVPRMVTE